MSKNPKEKRINRKGLLFILFYIIMVGVGYCNTENIGNSTNLIPEESISANPISKIQPELLEKIQNSSAQQENVNLFLMVYEDLESSILPNGVSILKKYELIDAYLVKAPVSSIFKLANLPEIKSIWEDSEYKSDLSSHEDLNPILKQASSNLDPNYVNYTEEVGATDLWEDGYNGSDIVIGVLDTGVDITGSGGGDLDDFDENTTTADPKYLGGVSMVPEEPLYYTDLNGRGTYHAGLACGTGNINSSHPGVAPGAYYLNVKVYDSIGITYWSFIISGIEWSISHGADILLFANTIPGLYFDPVCEAINNAVERGVLVVAPSGDDGPGYMSVNTPGAAHRALTVGAYNSKTGDVAEFSSRGPSFDFSVRPHVIAPGVDLIGPRARIFSEESLDMLDGMSDITDELGQYGLDFDYDLDIDTSMFTQTMIPTTQYGEDVQGAPNYTRSSGTGAAAAVVAGASAILMSAFPLSTPEMIQQALIETAHSTRNQDDMNAEGAGIIDVSAAFSYLQEIFTPNKYDILPASVPLLYAGVVTSNDYANVSDYSQMLNQDLAEYDISSTLSSQAMMSALVVSNSSEPDALNKTSIHLPLNQFGINYALSDTPEENNFHWFSEFDVVREMHQMVNDQFYQEGYKRYASVLEIDGLYTVVIAETWSYAGEYNDTTYNLNYSNPLYDITLPTEYNMMNITDRVNAIKFSFQFINDRDDGQSLENVSLVSYFKSDLYLNETGIASKNYQENIDKALNFTYDDIARFNSTYQTLYVEDGNNNTNFVSDDNCTSMGFSSLSHNISKYSIHEGISLLTNITFDGLESDLWNSTVNEYLELKGAGKEDPGFASVYEIGTIDPNQKKEFEGVLSVGQGNSTDNSRDIMFNQIDLIKNNVTEYNITDMMVLSANFSRMGKVGEEYNCKAKIINLGNVPIQSSQLAFAINKSNRNDVWEITSTIFMVKNLDVFEIREFTASWMPLEPGIYSVGWIFGDVSDIQVMQNEANLLSNSLSRTLYIINGTHYNKIKYERFVIFPKKLDQNPMKLYAPLDFGIYNLTVCAITDIKDVKVEAAGIGKNMILFLNPLLSDSEQLSQLNNMNDINGPIPATDSPNSSQIGFGDDESEEESPMGDFGSLSSFGSIDLPTSTEMDLGPNSAIPILLFANPLCPPGINRFNITFTKEGDTKPFYCLPVEVEIYPNRGRIWFDATHINLFVSDNLVGMGGLSGITDTESLNLSTDISESFGGFGDFDDISFESSDGFDLSAFLDLNERLDTTWGNFFNLRELWAEPESNNGKGASIYTIIPFLEMNLTDATGMNVTDFRTDEIVPKTSFLGKTLGDYYFENDTFTTNTINHDNLQFFDALVLNDPEQALLPSEIDAILEWVDNGGTLYVWSEDQYHSNVGSMNELLENFDMVLNNNSFFPYDEYGYCNISLGLNDKSSELFKDQSEISEVSFKDPIGVERLNGNQDVELLLTHDSGNSVLGLRDYGEGRVMVVGDNDAFKESLLEQNDNENLSREILKWGLQNYYESNITSTPSSMPQYDNGFIDFNITNYQEVQDKNLTSFGFLFISTFFYENGTMVNSSIYGIETPALPMFYSNQSHYGQFFDSTWYLETGDFYVLILIDHPAAASELYYVKFTVYPGEPPAPVQKYEQLSPAYPHYVDIAGIIANVHMFLLIWYYNFKKYETRLEIVPLKGNYLNVAKAKLSEGEALIRLLLLGLGKDEIDEIERIRFLLSHRKRFKKYFRDLKDFGESIGEHF